MKKITIILVSFTYVVAIIIVAAFGALSRIYNETIEVTQIVLSCARSLPNGGLLTYPEGVWLDDSVYALYSRPDGSVPTPEGGSDIFWSLDGLQLDYVLQIRGYKSIYDGIDWEQGKQTLDMGAFVLPEDATEQRLQYRLSDAAGDEPLETTIDDKGIMIFKEKLTNPYTAYLLTISATDNSSTKCYVRILIAGYVD